MLGHIRTELFGDSITKVMPHLTSGANKTTYDMGTTTIKIPKWDIEEETGYKPITTTNL